MNSVQNMTADEGNQDTSYRKQSISETNLENDLADLHREFDSAGGKQGLVEVRLWSLVQTGTAYLSNKNQ